MKFKIFTCLVVLSQLFLSSKAQLIHNMSFEKHCPALPIARINEVPYQIFDGNFELGVVAFHKDGINRVEFFATDGANAVSETATQFILNPRTNTKEYWITLNASAFSDDTVNITATVYANTGESRVLDIMLYANAGKTITEDTVFVSINGSDLNTGLSGNPVQTIEKALDILRVNKKFPAVIYITDEGSYDLPDINVGYKVIKNSHYITIRSATGLDPSKVIMQRPTRSLGRMGLNLTKWEGVTFDFGKISQYYAYGAPAVWFNNVKWINSYGTNDPCYTDTACITSHPARGTLYATNSSSTDMLYAFANFEIVRNCHVQNCIGDVFQNSNLVINCTVDTVDGTVLEHHTDLYQMWNDKDNVIVYGLTATNLISTQAIFLEPTYLESAGSPRYKFSNAAFVDMDIQHAYSDSATAANGGAPFSQMLSWFEHILFENVKLPQQHFSIRDELTHNQWWSASNVIFKKCQFHPNTYNNIINGSPKQGVTYIDPYTTYADCSDGIQNGSETGIDCGASCLRDEDGDGYFTGYCNPADTLNDCDDTNPDIHPGVTEKLNGVDNNCDGNLHADHALDFDTDGFINGFDNCIYTSNADQMDYDMDGIGDVCDSMFTYIEDAENRTEGLNDMNTLKERNGLSWEVARGTAEIIWNSISKDKDLKSPKKGSQGGNHILVCTQGRTSWSDLNVSMDIAASYSGPNRGFILLYQDSNNFYFFHLSGGAMKKRENGNDVVIGNNPSLVKAHGELDFIRYSARVVTDVTGVRFYISKNGNSEVMFYDPLPHVTKGSFGFISEADTSNGKNFGVTIDNIKLDVPVTIFPTTYDAGIVICQGETVTLTAEDGYSQYNWSTGATTKSIVVSNPGIYYVTAEDSTTCGGSDSVVVDIFNTVALGSDRLFCPGDTIILNAGSRFTTYAWSTGASTQSISVTSTGTYSVNVTDENGCISNDIIAVNPDPSCLSSLIESSAGTSIKISPSLNNGDFQININRYAHNSTGDVEIKVMAVNGQIVFSELIKENKQAYVQNVNLKQVSTGLYLVQIRVGDEMFGERIFIDQRLD